MKRIVNPCVCSTYYGDAKAYAKIEYENGKLSICGVVGPKRNGDCTGGAGQYVDEIRSGKPTEDWTNEMLQKFCDIWDRWHLNDMNPCCEHQRELGWLDKAKEYVTLYHFRLKREVIESQEAAKKEAITALKEGRIFKPTEEQTRLANLNYSFVSYKENTPEGYEAKNPLYPGDTGAIEKKMLGWLKPEEHPEGLLCRPCPVCGYKYGTSWVKEEVPQVVIDWLFSLPESRTKPAWV